MTRISRDPQAAIIKFFMSAPIAVAQAALTSAQVIVNVRSAAPVPTLAQRIAAAPAMVVTRPAASKSTAAVAAKPTKQRRRRRTKAEMQAAKAAPAAPAAPVEQAAAAPVTVTPTVTPTVTAATVTAPPTRRRRGPAAASSRPVVPVDDIATVSTFPEQDSPGEGV